MKVKAKLLFVAVLGLLALCGSAWAVEGSGPIAYWKLDEGQGSVAYDSVGGNDGTIYGAAWTTGQVDGALSFDGMNDYVGLGDIDEFEFGNNDFSISAWFYTKGTHGIPTKVGEIICKYRWSDSGRQWQLYQDASGNIGFYTNPTGGTGTHEYLVSLAGELQNQWVHVTAVRSGSTKLLYINGVLDTTGHTGGVVTEKTSGAYIGAVYDPDIGMRNFFNGTIDDVRIYDCALSAEDVQQLYLSGLSSYERAVINIEDAIAEKAEAMERIDAALEKEWSAYDALEELLESGDYGDLSKSDIIKARRKIRLAIRLEKWSKKVLGKSIEKLEDSLWFLGWEPEPLPEPIAYWKFDEGEGDTAYDSAGDNDGTVYGAVWTTGQIDGALSFDGDNDYVMVGDKDSLGPQELTLSFWAKLNNPSGRFQGGIAKGYVFGNVYEFSYRMDFTSGYLRAGITNTENIAFGNFGNFISIEDNNWHMWTMTVGDGNVFIYKDGLIADTAEYTGTIDYTKSHNNFVIGARDSGNYAFDGTIDDVRFYGLALSADQIQQLYQNGLN